MTRYQVAEQLRARAEFLRGRIWVNHSPREEGESCAVIDLIDPCVIGSTLTLESRIGLDAYSLEVLGYPSFWVWNDKQAEDRDEVCQQLEKAAAWVEEQTS